MGIIEQEIIEEYDEMYKQVVKNQAVTPSIPLIAILTTARILKRTMEKCAIEISCSIDDCARAIQPNLTIHQANAIIDMEDHGYSEGLGPETSSSGEAWDEMVVWAEAATGRKAVRNS